MPKAKAQAPSHKGYCVKCRQKVDIKDGKKVVTKKCTRWVGQCGHKCGVKSVSVFMPKHKTV